MQILFMIWKNRPTLEYLKGTSQTTLAKHLGIEFISIEDNSITAKMPVDERTKQPFGILHGGASVVLAETLGSVASAFVVENILKQQPVGLEINANHLKSVKEGFVYGTVKPIRLGRKIHVWNIEIKNEEGQLICISRLTCMIIGDT